MTFCHVLKLADFIICMVRTFILNKSKLMTFPKYWTNDRFILTQWIISLKMPHTMVIKPLFKIETYHFGII